jgi:hypothetical protein
MGSFDRIKPPEQRLLERRDGARLDEEPDPVGRAALFTASRAGDPSESDRAGSRGGLLGGLAVHCSRCDATTPLDPAVALRAALPLFLVAPWRDHPVFAVCPGCGARSWLAVCADA